MITAGISGINRPASRSLPRLFEEEIAAIKYFLISSLLEL